MKTKNVIIILFFLIGTIVLKAQNESSDTQKAIATLKEFYRVVYDDNLGRKE